MTSIIFKRLNSELDSCLSDIEYCINKAKTGNVVCLKSALLFVDSVYRINTSVLEDMANANNAWDEINHYGKIYANALFKLVTAHDIFNRRSDELTGEEHKMIFDKILACHNVIDEARTTL